MWGKKKATRKVKHTKELDLTERVKVQTSLNKQIEERQKKLLKEQYTLDSHWYDMHMIFVTIKIMLNSWASLL